jgi:NADH-quinone oxidoreductase subunit G
MGAALMGGGSLDDALGEVEAGNADGLVVLENDLFRRAPARRVEEALSRLRFIAVVDHLRTPTAERADLLLPAATFAESTGTLVNNGGRAQRFYQVFIGARQERAGWQILAELRHGMSGGAPCESSEQVLAAIGEAIPALAGAMEASPSVSWRSRVGEKVAHGSHRYSGRTAETADRSVFEPQPREDGDSPFSFSMEGAQHHTPSALTARYWRPGWNSVQACFSANEREDEASEEGLGKRLLEPGAASVGGELAPARWSLPEALGPGELWLTPRPAIFGSEELSRMAPAIASVMPKAAVVLHPDEASRRSLPEGVMARIEADGECYLLPVKLDDGVAQGVAIVPSGYPETAGLIAPCRVPPGACPPCSGSFLRPGR